MKKLIEELERKYSELYKGGYDSDVLSVLDDAIEIVKSHNPWYEASELPPYHEGQFKDSIEVHVIDFKAKIRSVGFYSYERKCWETDYRPMNVTHWAYLPEVKP